MDKKDIFIVVALLVFVAFRIYQKYFRKGQNIGSKAKTKSHDAFLSTKDDDYEPYSGK